MGFDEEWGRLRADAAARQTSMQLNGTGDGPLLPGAQDFGHAPEAKRKAANAIHEDVEPMTEKAAKHADEASGNAVKEFKGWDTAAGLKTVNETWDKQVRTLMGQLMSQESNLRGARNLFMGNDLATNSQFGLVRKSGLDHH
ncbi:hypothetical protein [Streptomyces sp. MUM 178J]|uniref:hypothetical protein n=1 Tax=Streptomyces sp. MUM 178J TaxID=2791991 RepID=UPI001F04D6CD|nr:hypothetical protein [Streptomyces sp. MUM 178J]WRQ80919.1 hypothetical protein I3F59_017010 [Streptomyces sp. MUM 178J]